LELYTQLEDAAAMAYAHNALGETARAAGDWQASREHYRASLDLAQQVGHERSIAVAQSNLGSVEIALGDLTTARQRLVKSLPIFMALDDRVNIASCLATLACIDTQANSTAARVRAAQLFGLATRMIQDANGKFETADARDFKYWTAECRAALGEENFERAWDEGSGATVRDAVVWLESPGMRAADLT
jgi:tetratricopeptide (TPR) repeat protein